MKRKVTDDSRTEHKSSEEQDETPSKVRKKTDMGGHEFSSQEISKLKETEALFYSSLFRLQVSELLKEVSVKHKLMVRLEEAVDYLKGLINNLSVGKEHKIMDREWMETKAIKIPLLENPAEVKGTFQFRPPADVKLTGSFSLNTMLKPDVSADLILHMPKDFFQPKDFLNHRYTRKRALYLCAIASRICKKKRIELLKFSYLMGNMHKPVLIVTVKGMDDKKVKLCLHAVPESGSFKPSRFHVSKNNIRPRWFIGESGSENDEDSLPSTPFYNCSVLHDVCCDENDRFIQSTLSSSDGVRDGILLLKVWLRQRELLKVHTGFSSHLLNCYVTYLLMTKKLNKMMNSYQVFRNTLLFLSKSDWIDQPPSLYLGEREKTQPSIDEFRTTGSCVFVDRSGFFNMAYMLTPHVFARLKSEAQLALETFDQKRQNSFEILFMTPVTFARKYDHIFHLSLKDFQPGKALEKLEGLRTQWMDHGHLRLSLGHRILNILSEALEKRVTLIQMKPYRLPEWGISEDAFSFETESQLTFGLALNTTNAFNVLDKGPPAETPEAKEFRDFWGVKSEMRRFKDGTIHEAVLWTDSNLQVDKRRVCKNIVEHVLNRHLGISKKHVQYMEGKLDSLLQLHTEGSKNQYGTGEDQTLAVLETFDSLNRTVRSLTSLPLAIHSIQGISPVFRHADVFPPLPICQSLSENGQSEGRNLPVLPKQGKVLARSARASEVICMLEGSGKWPEEIKAIQCLKTLLHIKMGTELKEKHLLAVTIQKNFVDVFKNGFVFRLRIANTRELAVLRTVTSDDGMVKFRDTADSLALEKQIVALPLLSSLIHSVQQAHPLFSLTVRLCKRWLAAQMVWGLISEEALELMVAHMFIASHPFTPPGSPNAGLLRFLHLLSSFNWASDALMVNLNQEFTDDDLVTIPKEFSKNRATLPSMCICTPHDKTGTRWTKPMPTGPILERLKVLARGALKILEAQIIEPETASSDFKTIFRPPAGLFDVNIHLMAKANSNVFQGLDENIKVSYPDIPEKQVAPKKDTEGVPVTNFNAPVKFFHDLRRVFGDVAMFFYDPFGGSVIGLVWRPQVMEQKDFRPSHFHHRKPVVDNNEDVKLILDKELVIEQIKVMGGGIVKDISHTSLTDR